MALQHEITDVDEEMDIEKENPSSQAAQSKLLSLWRSTPTVSDEAGRRAQSMEGPKLLLCQDSHFLPHLLILLLLILLFANAHQAPTDAPRAAKEDLEVIIGDGRIDEELSPVQEAIEVIAGDSTSDKKLSPVPGAIEVVAQDSTSKQELSSLQEANEVVAGDSRSDQELSSQ
ncbi:hypothetical protein HGM15179_018434 [Zosterops borbonicus]|uniref:Uncharacterized protein n=1 Tax=Zosterops borbonicus TaxID=364589 RepID=A0A8K1FZ15_9PASS|nr:hypothetical protein HGM15179_018434 [Zosterops borbonicus]